MQFCRSPTFFRNSFCLINGFVALLHFGLSWFGSHSPVLSRSVISVALSKFEGMAPSTVFFPSVESGGGDKIHSVSVQAEHPFCNRD